MSQILWKLPGAATEVHDSKFEALGGRVCRLSIATVQLEGDQDTICHHKVRFEGVEAYRCTYLTSLVAEMINAAYGRPVDLGPTEWVHELAKRAKLTDLKHLMICFDGPCYEIACRRYSLE